MAGFGNRHHWLRPQGRGCGCAMQSAMDVRHDVIPLAWGQVFELGCGGGINQHFYDRRRVKCISGIDPSSRALKQARAASRALGWQADLREGVGEAIPFDDASFDTVVCTFTLCSVHDHARALSELHRVLRPGGTLLYAEHGRAPDQDVARWQERVEPVWTGLMGNCHLSRPVTPAIAAAGFRPTPAGKRYRQRRPKFAGWMEWGMARKPRSGLPI